MLIWLFQWLDCSVWSLHVQAGSCVLVVCPHNSLSTSFCCNKIFLILYFLIVSPGISQCCKEPWFLLVKNDIVVENPPASAGGTGDMGSIPGKIPWSRKWQPLPVYLLGKFRGQRSLAGYSPWGCRESDTAERLSVQVRTHAGSVLSAVGISLLL